MAFNLDEIYNANEEQQFAIAEILAAMNFLDSKHYSSNMSLNLHQGEYCLFITVDDPEFKAAFEVLRDFLAHYNSGEIDSDEFIKMEYEDDLKRFSVPIKEM